MRNQWRQLHSTGPSVFEKRVAWRHRKGIPAWEKSRIGLPSLEDGLTRAGRQTGRRSDQLLHSPDMGLVAETLPYAIQPAFRLRPIGRRVAIEAQDDVAYLARLGDDGGLAKQLLKARGQDNHRAARKGFEYGGRERIDGE